MLAAKLKLAPLVLAGSVLAACGGGTGSSAADQPATSPKFSDPRRIDNPYLPIAKFHRCVLAGTDGGQHIRVVRTLLGRTQPFSYAGQSIDAAVVRDVVIDTKAQQRIEKTLDFFAQDDAGSVYYLGEDVNEYKNGRLAGHEGQWRLGRDTQNPGVLMVPNPQVGDAFTSEDVPGIVHETSHLIATGKRQRVAGHAYSNVIRIRENAAPPPEVEYKTYAPGTGVLTEANGGVRLVGCSTA